MQKRNYKRKTTKKVASKALTKPQQRQVKKLIHQNLEDKYVDEVYNYTNQSYNTGLSTPYLLTSATNPIGQGTAQGQRVGDRITLRSLDLRLTCYHNTSGTTDPNNGCRLIIFKWKLNNSVSSPVLGGILQYQPGVTTLSYGVNSPYYWVNARNDDYAILYDKKFSLAPGDASNNNFHIKLNKYLGNIEFTPGAIQGSGHIYLMFVCDDGAPVAPCPTVSFISRIKYEDA